MLPAEVASVTLHFKVTVDQAKFVKDTYFL